MTSTYDLMKLYTHEELENAVNVVADLEFITGKNHDELINLITTIQNERGEVNV